MAVVIGAAFKAVIDALVAFIINPIIAAIFGQPDISGVLAIKLRSGEAGEPDTELLIGAFFQEVLNFVIIAAALFVFIKAFEAMQNRRAQEEAAAPDAPSDEVVLLTQIRDGLSAR